jgi:hypothetical protein
MATTTNYSWTTPDDTDLVKDGAAAIRTLGTAIDTTVFTNAGAAINKTIVDAKGDIIAATAADTVSRVAVGSNFAFLQADSAESTGLLWNNAAWTNYTPTITPGSGSYTTASASGSYTRVGKLCVLRVRGLVTSVGTGTNPVFSLPFTAATTTSGGKFIGSIRENAATGLTGIVSINSGSTTMEVFRYDNNAFVGNNYEYSMTISYEVA